MENPPKKKKKKGKRARRGRIEKGKGGAWHDEKRKRAHMFDSTNKFFF